MAKRRSAAAAMRNSGFSGRLQAVLARAKTTTKCRVNITVCNLYTTVHANANPWFRSVFRAGALFRSGTVRDHPGSLDFGGPQGESRSRRSGDEGALQRHLG